MTSREIVIFTLRNATTARCFFRHENRGKNTHSRNEWTFFYNVNRFKRKLHVEHFVALSAYNVLFSTSWNLILYCYPGTGSFRNRESLLSFAGFNRDFGSGDRRISTEHRDIFQTRQTGERVPFDWLEWRTCRNFWVYCS